MPPSFRKKQQLPHRKLDELTPLPPPLQSPLAEDEPGGMIRCSPPVKCLNSQWNGRAAISVYFGSTWLELDTLGFSRTQFGTQQGYFEGISGLSEKRLDLRNCLTDAALEVVPGGGIEPSTHGFSVRCSTD